MMSTLEEAPVEHERRFVVVRNDWRTHAHSPTRIFQGWLCYHDGLYVRVRISGNVGSVACKIPIGDPGEGRRLEIEAGVGADMANDLAARCVASLEKTRWLVPVAEHTYEVDEYHKELNGVVVAELENPPDLLSVPLWIGKDVTGMREWSNYALAVHGAPPGVE